MRTYKTMLLCALGLLGSSCAIGRSQSTTAGDDAEAGSTSDVSGTTAGSATGAVAPTPAAGQDANTVLSPVINTITNYTTIGRFYAVNANALTFALPASQIGGRFTGTSLAVSLSDTGYDYFDVILDGNTWVAPTFLATTGCLPVARAQAQSSNANAVTGCVRSVPAATAQTYVIATGLTPGNHTAWLVKRTEMYQGSGTSAVGQTTFYGFVLDANATLLTAPTPNTRHIDFIGDSAFTGYGAGQLMHDASDYCDFTAHNQDAATSVPYLTGKLLRADAVNVSASGQGIVDGVYDSNPNHLLPVLFEETLPPSAAPAYAFSTQADVVVITGGGDDLNGASGSGSFSDPNAFVAGYAQWLQKIRAHYPNALIVCGLTSGAQGADIATLGGALQKAVAMRKTLGDTKVVYFSFFMNDTSFTTYGDIAQKCGFYYGCKYHPSPAGAQWLAGRLATFVRGQMAWTE